MSTTKLSIINVYNIFVVTATHGHVEDRIVFVKNKNDDDVT